MANQISTTERDVKKTLPSLIALGCSIIGLCFELAQHSDSGFYFGFGLLLRAGAVAVADLMS